MNRARLVKTGFGECRRHAAGAGPAWPQTRSTDWCLEFVEGNEDRDPNSDIRPWRHISEVEPECAHES